MATELSVREFARKRGVSLKAVYDQLAVGRVPGAYKCGKNWRIPADQQYIRQHQPETEGAAPNRPDL